MFWWPMLASAAISAAGAIQQGRQSAASAKKQMVFQESMSNTAHQRQVADLRAAGLNPILSARLGGASTPSGAQQQVVPNIGGAAANSAMKAYDVQTMGALRGSQANLADNQAGVAALEQGRVKQDTELKRMEAMRAGEQAQLFSQQRKIGEITEQLQELSLAGARNVEELNKELGPILQGLEKLGPLGVATAKLLKGFVASMTTSSAKGARR